MSTRGRHRIQTGADRDLLCDLQRRFAAISRGYEIPILLALLTLMIGVALL